MYITRLFERKDIQWYNLQPGNSVSDDLCKMDGPMANILLSEGVSWDFHSEKKTFQSANIVVYVQHIQGIMRLAKVKGMSYEFTGPWIQ